MANFSFRLGKVFAWIGLLSALIMLAGFVVLFIGPPVRLSNVPSDSVGRFLNLWGTMAVVGSALTSLVAMVGTASTVLLGWRSDRRQSQEFRLKIEQLELQLAETRRASASSKVEANNTAPA
jgi:hypothetical protein